MRGIDLLDAMTARCIPSHIDPINGVLLYSWFLTTSSMNAWRIRVQTTQRKEPYLEFLRELVIGMTAEHGCQSEKQHGRSMVIPCMRGDGCEHWIISTQGVRSNCRQCPMPPDGEEGSKDFVQIRKVWCRVACPVLQEKD